MDEKLIKNARKPEGEYGEKMIERMNKSHESLAQWGVSHLDIGSSDIILDIGCGGGINVQRFSNMAPEGKIYGLDYSEVSVEKSKELNKDIIEKGQVEIDQGSVSELPYDDETFDLVTGFETVYFWPDFINDLKEVKRVLKKGGSIFICNEASGSNEDKELMEDHINLLGMKVFTEDGLGDSLIEAGFNEVLTFTKESNDKLTHKDTDWLCAIARK
jgi:ubiquinone/menaquinone biosynthesis C-methylase UbiE